MEQQVGRKMRSLNRLVVRQGKEMNSPKVGELDNGKVIKVLETGYTTSAATPGVRVPRVRYNDGVLCDC